MTPEQLEQILRTTVRVTTAEFSGDLHARLMADVARERVRAARRRISWAFALVTAAAVALIFTFRHPAPSPAPQVASLQPVTEFLVQTLRPLPERLQEVRFAHLDHDAKRLARFLLNQIPSLPEAASVKSRSPSNPPPA